MKKKFVLLLIALVASTAVQVKAANPINNALVHTELYVWNRVADFLEILRGGVAAGPSIGAEVAITEYAQLGAYASNEKGVSFPNFLPPLWLITYLDEGELFVTHGGTYYTYSYGPNRFENTLQNDVRFRRGRWDVRAQVALGVVHLYSSIETRQVGDFFAGLVGVDPMNDDAKLDPNATREPARQLGRGITNVLTGVFEVPKSMHYVNQQEGGFAAVTYGLFQGLYRFATREVVGAVEVITFPMGWEPIIEPEFPFEPGTATKWRVNEWPFMENRY